MQIFFSVSNRDEKYESNSLDDFNTDDYTIGLFYKGTVLKHLNLSSELGFRNQGQGYGWGEMVTVVAPIYPGGQGWRLGRWNVASGLFCGWAPVGGWNLQRVGF